MDKKNQTLHYFILSDSIGETALKVARAALVHFPSAKTVLHKYTFISNIEKIDEITHDALKYDGLLFMTIADSDLAKYVEKKCIETGLICYNLVQPYTLEIQRRLGIAPTSLVGAQHELSDEYFDRIEAMEFCMKYDDGKDPKGIGEAEIVLLGISRTGKTPLSMYLASSGYKVCNLPLIPENELPDILFEISKSKIIGLTNNVSVVNKHREIRMLEYGMPEGSRYASSERVSQELAYADEVYRKLGCPVINVADRSIEESAHIISEIMKLVPHAF